MWEFLQRYEPSDQPILLLYARSSYYNRVTVQLSCSFDSSLQCGINLTLLVLGCLQPLVIPVTLSSAPPMTSRLVFVLSFEPLRAQLLVSHVCP